MGLDAREIFMLYAHPCLNNQQSGIRDGMIVCDLVSSVYTTFWILGPGLRRRSCCFLWMCWAYYAEDAPVCLLIFISSDISKVFHLLIRRLTSQDGLFP